MLRRLAKVLGGIALCLFGLVVVGFGGLHFGFTLYEPPIAAVFAVVVVLGLLLSGFGVRVFSANVPLHWDRATTTVPVLRRGDGN